MIFNIVFVLFFKNKDMRGEGANDHHEEYLQNRIIALKCLQ